MVSVISFSDVPAVNVWADLSISQAFVRYGLGLSRQNSKKIVSADGSLFLDEKALMQDLLAIETPF